MAVNRKSLGPMQMPKLLLVTFTLKGSAEILQGFAMFI